MDPTAIDNIKFTPLVNACFRGSLDIVRYLVERMQEYVKLEDILYSSYETIGDLTISGPLCSACFGGHLSVIKYLIEECNCDPSRPDDGKLTTPVLAAVSGSQLNVMKYLVTKQVKVGRHSKVQILYYRVSNTVTRLQSKFKIQGYFSSLCSCFDGLH